MGKLSWQDLIIPRVIVLGREHRRLEKLNLQGRTGEVNCAFTDV